MEIFIYVLIIELFQNNYKPLLYNYDKFIYTYINNKQDRP